MTREEFIKALRHAADIYERHPEIPEPCGVDMISCILGDDARERLAAAVRALGGVEKDYQDSYLSCEHVLAGGKHGAVRIRLIVHRDAVCRRVVTQKVIPARPETVLPAEPEKVVDEVSWECSEPILAPFVGATSEAFAAAHEEEGGSDE